ncbi:hypothetical protein ABID92_001066 [Frigoribacterium sp. PvP120]|nr:hypothetical protein [Frigoribacterium sp. PvP121]NII49996.1 hypothetical protein [Frigoribacterium endophyticum]
MTDSVFIPTSPEASGSTGMMMPSAVVLCRMCA